MPLLGRRTLVNRVPIDESYITDVRVNIILQGLQVIHGEFGFTSGLLQLVLLTSYHTRSLLFFYFKEGFFFPGVWLGSQVTPLTVNDPVGCV